jgi:hypothetical protein
MTAAERKIKTQTERMKTATANAYRGDKGAHSDLRPYRDPYLPLSPGMLSPNLVRRFSSNRSSSLGEGTFRPVANFSFTNPAF